MVGVAVILGFALRLYSFVVTPVINPDGTFYIQQAKALHYGLWDQVLSCYPYLSSYPLLIALNYRVFGDWVISAKVVSLVFGTATLIPLYLLLRRFLGVKVSWLAVLIFAVSPPFVELSREVIRGPLFWFFAVWGLYLVIKHMEKQSLTHLLMASVSFLMGAWARTEGLLFILVVPLYLLFSGGERRWRKTAAFVIPPALVTLAVGILLWSFQFHLGDLFAAKKMEPLLSGPFTSYQGLRESLEAMKDTPEGGMSPYFLDKVRNLLWLVALGALFVEVVRAFFLPFSLIFVSGLKGVMKRVREDPRVLFLVLTSICALLLLYVQVIHYWTMYARFMAVFLFPAFVFVGFGVQRIFDFVTDRLKLRESIVCGMLLVSILLVAVPKTLQSHDRSDKVVFKEMGETIAERKGDCVSVSVGAGFKEVRLVHFYAHVDDRAAVCFEDPRGGKGGGRDTLGLTAADFDYYIWDEKTGTEDLLVTLRSAASGAMKELGDWHSLKMGRLILFEVQK